MSEQNSQFAVAHNLPPQPTSFIGREPEIVEIVDLLRDRNCRLLTLVGIGGMGKTRLAIESVCRLSADDFKHGVYYVPLTPLSSPDNILATIIGVLRILIGEDGTPQDELIDFLSGRNLLLVMDNFEHVLDGADLVADILNHTSDVTILTTSREVLNLQMEWVWRVKGMSYPDTDTHDIELYSALRLFINRAKQTRRDFSVEHELERIIRICQLAEGMPLAIELAASWLKTLSCEEIIKQIERGIDFLTTRIRDIPQRHRSIRAVFDYSWDLLTDDEQAVFPRLSLFHGGFTLEAARIVADADLVTLSGLVEKSMIRRDSKGRYDIHELLRQYGFGKLTALDDVTTVRVNHHTFFLSMLCNQIARLKSIEQLEALNEIEIDFENIQHAWWHAIDSGDTLYIQNAAEGLFLYCLMRNRVLNAEALLNQEFSNLPSDLTVRLHQYWRVIALTLGISRSQYDVYVEQDRMSHNQAVDNGDEHMIAVSLWSLSWSLWRLTQYESAAKLPDEVAFKHITDKFYLSRISHRLATSFVWLRRFERAWELMEQALMLAQDTGDMLGQAWIWADASFVSTDCHQKRQSASKSLAIMNEMNNTAGIATVKFFFGLVLFGQGDISTTNVFANEIVSLALHIHSKIIEAFGLSLLGHIALINGDYSQCIAICEKSIIMINHPIAVYHQNLSSGLASLLLNDVSTCHEKCKALVPSINREMIPPCAFIGAYGLPAWGWLFLVALRYGLDASLGEPAKLRSVTLLSLISAYLKIDLLDTPNWLGKLSFLPDVIANLKRELGDRYPEVWQNGQSLDFDTELDKEIAVITNNDAQPMIMADDQISVHTNEKEILSASQLHKKDANQSLIEPLTSRELEILLLIHDGLSNRQIAEQLVVVEDTVKKHITHLYSKLNVKRRTQAIARARELNLL